MSDDTLFHQMMRGEIPMNPIYEDELCFAIRDIAPQAPTHLLLIPKPTLINLHHAQDDHQALLGHLLVTASKIMKEQVGDEDYRIVINNGAGASQSIFQLHLHLLSGRSFTWPPG